MSKADARSAPAGKAFAQKPRIAALQRNGLIGPARLLDEPEIDALKSWLISEIGALPEEADELGLGG